jgi:hypothetical protein
VRHNPGICAKADVHWRRTLFTFDSPKSTLQNLRGKPYPLSLDFCWEARELYSEMAQTQARKRKSDVLNEQEHDLQTSTPTSSPSRKRTKITQSQKQALIDNLQLESELPYSQQKLLNTYVIVF